MNWTCRVLAALVFMGGLSVHLRWVPSEWNPADEPSRLSGPGLAAAPRDRTRPSDARVVEGRAEAAGAAASDGMEIVEALELAIEGSPTENAPEHSTTTTPRASGHLEANATVQGRRAGPKERLRAQRAAQRQAKHVWPAATAPAR